jgi:stage III sporulation protein AH
MTSAKQRIIVLAGLAVLLIAAPILNYQINIKNKSTATKSVKPTASLSVQTDTGSVTTGNFFVDYVSEREQKRTAELKYLDSIINDTKTDADTLKTTNAQKASIALSMEKELTVENLLKAKGFDKVAVVYKTGSVSIVIGKSELTDAEVAQILDIARTETGEKAANIRIVPVK